MDHEHIPAAHCLKRPRLVLAILEIAFLVRPERRAEVLRNPFAEGAAAV
jgi:hypothetical protein